MVAISVVGNGLGNMVQPNLIVRFIRSNSLAIFHDFTEDRNYNITLFLKEPCETCFNKLCEEFPQYAFSIL